MLRFDTARTEVSESTAKGAVFARFFGCAKIINGKRFNANELAADLWKRVIAGDKAAWHEMKDCGVTVWDDEAEGVAA